MPNTFTKAIISKSTAVWGGGLARMTSMNDKWLGIPTGHMQANAQFGTSTNPDTSYTLSSTADDLLGVIWNPVSTIEVVGCKISYGEGGTTIPDETFFGINQAEGMNDYATSDDTGVE